ncbi:acetyltransferase [Sulfuricurvum sp.]|uniref:acetyltransferase n=1 Tax=Sulfuricurvum sp. TaxID=2025608 RepID=UPI003C65F6F9
MEPTKEIYIYGMSGHGRVVADVALACGYTIAGWIDDADTNDVPNWETFERLHTDGAIALGIGDNRTRSRIADKIILAGHTLPPLIHPSAIISPSATIGIGSLVMPLCVVNANAMISRGTIVNSGAIIEHDCILGAYSHISPNASLAGGVSVGDFTHIGIGSVILQNITVGQNTIVGAGAVVIDNLPDNCTAVGVPANIIRS